MTDDRNLILDQEKRLVASVLLGGAAVDRELLTEVHPDRFLDGKLARTWSALRRVLGVTAGPVDLIDAIASELGDGEDVPSRIDLHELATLEPSAANGRYYAQRVREAGIRRTAAGMIGEAEAERTADMATSDLLLGIEERARSMREELAGPHRNLPEPLIGSGWDEEPPPREWLVDGWLPAGELALLTGPGSVGKGVLALQIAAALACDRKPLQKAGGWLPASPAVSATAPELCGEPAHIVVTGWEDDRHEVMRRRHRLTMYGGCGWSGHPSINERLHVLPMRGFGPLWAPDPGSRHVSTVGGMTPAGDHLLRYAEEVNARLLVVDPAGLAICTNENDRALVSLALDAFAGWATRTGCAVLLVGHPAKASEGEAASYSGSTAWRGCVRALWTLRQPGDRQVDRGSAEWRGIVGRDPDRQERVALLSRNKNNYGWDGDHLTVTTRGGRAGWYLTDSLPAPARQIGKETAAAANGTGTVPVGRPGAVPPGMVAP